MNTSLLIARIIGPFYIFVGTGILRDREFFRRAAMGFEESPALFYLSGALAYIVGALIIAIHNVWSGWPILITLLGWAAILKGVMRIMAPEHSRALVARLVTAPNTITITGVGTLVFGAILTGLSFASA